MGAPQGYTFRTPSATRIDGKPAWHAKVRRKNWQAGYWVTVSSQYGPICYASRDAAVDAVHWWIMQNESDSETSAH